MSQRPVSVEEAIAVAIERHRAGRFAEAEQIYRQVLAQHPDHAVALQLLGLLAYQTGHNQSGIDLMSRSIALDPARPEPHNNLGNALMNAGRIDDAIGRYRQAIALNPNYAAAWNNLGDALKSVARLDEAIDCFRRAAEIQPQDHTFLDNVIYTMHFHPAYDPHAIRREQQRWQERYVDPLRERRLPHVNTHDPQRRLRVGYVSPHFYHHAECFFVVPLLEAHDREQYEVYFYSGVRKPDFVTERLRRCADAWREAAFADDDALEQRIRDDQIDILVDLTMHMGQTRLPVFARKPAPVQVSWLAYPGTTGIDAIDYRLTDRFMEPAGANESWSSETPIRLPDCWVVYEPIFDPAQGGEPPVAPLPALRTGHITFGSLNDPCKINDAVLELWSRALRAAGDNSRLILRFPECRERDRIIGAFESRGIARDRLEFAPFVPRREYLQLYDRIDLALDTFPYNGITTTCDALRMGVVVVTLPGDRPQSRAGLAMLTQLSLEEFACTSVDHFVRTIANWASDLPRLANLRKSLRNRMHGSPVMDKARFARNVEGAYRDMWRRFVCL